MAHLSFYIAKRYLFAKKSHKAVNIISLISLFGFAIGTAALVIVMSVFNGFESLIAGMYNQFDPDLKISAQKGKTMLIEGDIEDYLAQHPGIADYTKVLEEQALIRYNGKQTTATIKGVDSNYDKVTDIDSLMLKGHFTLKKGDTKGAILGMGLAHQIGAGIKFINALVVYAPKRIGNISMTNPENSFETEYFFPTAFFAIYQPEIDNQYMLIDLKEAQELFLYKNEISAVEIRLNSYKTAFSVKKDLEKYLGKAYKVQNKLEQRMDLYRMLSMEKWIAFFIVVFILIIAVFNIVGTLSMLIIEKKNDIKTLQSIGATNKLIRQVFFTEGRMVAFCGAVLGLVLGLVISLLQQHLGLIKLGGSGQFIIDAYPVVIQPADLLLIFITVTIIGSVATFFPVKYITKRFGL